MKEIKLKNFAKSRKKYIVNFGNGATKEFSDKRLCESFLYGASNFLTAKLHELYQLNIELINCYHENWFYTENGRTKKNNLWLFEQNSKEYLNEIEKLFNIAVQRSSWENGNHFIFIHFEK